jgi:hypothetical protein
MVSKAIHGQAAPARAALLLRGVSTSREDTDAVPMRPQSLPETLLLTALA